jgi:putative ABC transport system permease protein
MVRSLIRNRAAVALLTLEVAFSLAVAIHSAAIPVDLLRRARVHGALEPETLYAVTVWGEGNAEARLSSLASVTAVARVQRPVRVSSQIPQAVAAAASGRRAVAWTMGADERFPGVVGSPLREGRWPAEAGEVAITESLARALFAGTPPLGQTLLAPEPVRVTGVLADVVLANNWSVSAEHALLRPLAPVPHREVFLARAGADGFAGAARAALADRTLVKVERISERIALDSANASGTLWVIAFMVLLTVLVTALGAAAMVAALVTARTREIGLRRALGARRGQIVGHFVAEAGLIVGAGLLLGLVLTAALAHFAGTPSPVLVAAGVGLFTAVTLMAAWASARRAAAVAPSVAGRSV